MTSILIIIIRPEFTRLCGVRERETKSNSAIESVTGFSQ